MLVLQSEDKKVCCGFIWMSAFRNNPRKLIKNCLISRLVSFSVSREVLTSRLDLVSVWKILVSLMVSHLFLIYFLTNWLNKFCWIESSLNKSLYARKSLNCFHFKFGSSFSRLFNPYVGFSSSNVKLMIKVTLKLLNNKSCRGLTIKSCAEEKYNQDKSIRQLTFLRKCFPYFVGSLTSFESCSFKN
jgi:hypothetical protein